MSCMRRRGCDVSLNIGIRGFIGPGMSVPGSSKRSTDIGVIGMAMARRSIRATNASVIGVAMVAGGHGAISGTSIQIC